MRGMKIAEGAIFIIVIFIGIAFVPASCMSDNTTIDEWMQDHTVKVNSTTTCKYEQEYLLINETYTGEELKARFGIEYFTKELKIPVEDNVLVEGRVLGMQEGEARILVTEKETVLTTGDDPPQWWDNYTYPQWVWFEDSGIYERGLPINLAWRNTTKDVAKSEILEEGWVDNPIQYTEYVYDPIDGWIIGDGVATDRYGIFGRYHVNLWQMFDGNVVANAHHDCSAFPFGHEADELEVAEELVAGFFNESEDIEWNVYEDSYNLDNNVTSPYSDCWCTQISYANVFDTEAPANPYPGIAGNHTGTITLNHTITVSTLYTYPCPGTGGHTEYAAISHSNGTEIAEAHWNGYIGDWHNISFNETFTLIENETYNYTMKTGSYPQIHHTDELEVASGTITCEEFVDANGKKYTNWIPAIRLE